MTNEQKYIAWIMKELSGCKYLYNGVLEGMKEAYIHQTKEVIDELAWKTAVVQALGHLGFVKTDKEEVD